MTNSELEVVVDLLGLCEPEMHNRICEAAWRGLGFGESYGHFVTTDECRIADMAIASASAAANLQLIVEAFASSNNR